MKFFLRDLIASTYMLMCRIYPVNKKMFVFKSDRGAGCTDSPLCLFEALKELYPDYESTWILEDPSQKPEGSKAVQEGSFAEIKALATSRYWVDNKRKGCWAVKRRGQIYIQTWHGPIALKKVEKDIEDKLPAYYIKSCKHDSKIADYFLSGSRWTTDFYRKSFWYDGKILEYGVPRSDKFYKDPGAMIRKVHDTYGIGDSTKLVLYAPTFRDDGRTDVYNLDYRMVLDAMRERFGGDWKILVRLHPNMQKETGIVSYSEDILNGNLVEDIGDLIMASEALITDYSSCMFDAMEADKFIMIYAPDIELYTKDRGFAMPMESLPFPIGQNNDEIREIIQNTDMSGYLNKVRDFIEEIGVVNDGNASLRILRYLLENKE